MQKKGGQKAEAMNSAELAALLDHDVLPKTLQQRLDADGITLESAAFDDQCKAFARRVNLEHVWYLIMYPFSLSTDNCQKHCWPRRLFLRPRLNETEWAEFEAQLEQEERQYVHECIVDSMEEAYAVDGIEIEDDELDFLARMKLAENPQLRVEILARFQRQHDMPFKMSVLRREMRKKPWLRIVFPHQFMPLTPITPDAHQVIEHRVHEAKLDLAFNAWKLLKDGEDTVNLLLAKTYQDLIIASAKKRSGPQGRLSIQQSIVQMRALLRTLATPTDRIAAVFLYRKVVRKNAPEDAPPEWKLKFELHWGTAGGWGPSSLS